MNKMKEEYHDIIIGIIIVIVLFLMWFQYTYYRETFYYTYAVLMIIGVVGQVISDISGRRKKS